MLASCRLFRLYTYGTYGHGKHRGSPGVRIGVRLRGQIKQVLKHKRQVQVPSHTSVIGFYHNAAFRDVYLAYRYSLEEKPADTPGCHRKIRLLAHCDDVRHPEFLDLHIYRARFWTQETKVLDSILTLQA